MTYPLELTWQDSIDASRRKILEQHALLPAAKAKVAGERARCRADFEYALWYSAYGRAAP